MAHYTTEDLMRFGLIHLLEEGRFNELIADIKTLLNGYENGFFLSGEVMEKILERIEIAAKDFSYVTTEEYSDDSVAVFHVAHKFLLGILFEYIGHSNLEPDQFIKLITNRE